MIDSEDEPSPGSLALVEAAEAEAEEAEARAQAAKARARAARLRHELHQDGQTGGTGEVVDESPADESGELSTEATDLDDAGELDKPAPPARKRFRRPRGRTIGVAVAVIVLIAVLALNGLLFWHHHRADQQRAHAEQFAAAARQGVVNMTTLDYTKAEADVARVLDSATGEFRTDFASRVDDFTSVVKDSKVTTVGTVTAAAVESMTNDSAVVLVAATSTVTNAAGAKQEPRKWRLSVTVTRADGQLKMSKVEFVP